jgi:hypothetical protein
MVPHGGGNSQGALTAQSIEVGPDHTALASDLMTTGTVLSTEDGCTAVSIAWWTEGVDRAEEGNQVLHLVCAHPLRLETGPPHHFHHPTEVIPETRRHAIVGAEPALCQVRPNHLAHTVDGMAIRTSFGAENTGTGEGVLGTERSLGGKLSEGDGGHDQQAKPAKRPVQST